MAIMYLGFSFDPPAGNTGAPGESLCSGCHTGNNPLDGTITISGLPAEIVVNTSYDVTVTLTKTMGTPIRGGFQMVTLDGNNNNSGTYTNFGANVGSDVSGGRTYIEHRNAKNFSGNDEVEYTFTWNAPASIPGNEITMYVAANFANGNGNNQGDRIVNTSLNTPLQSGGGNDPNVEIVDVEHVSCFGGNDGSASTEVTDGVPPYVYNWSNGAQTASINNVTAGTYSVTVTDANSSTTMASVVITEPDELTVSLNFAEEITCDSPDAEISVSADGGTTPYSYLWSTNDTGPNIFVNAGGNYTVTVTDANLCTATLVVTVTENVDAPIITAGPDLTIPCFGGTVELQGDGPLGGNIVLGWSTSNGNIISGANTYNPIVDAIGEYTLSVINLDNGCSSEDVMSVTSIPDPIQANVIVENASCFGANNGMATVNATGGSGSYTYLWSTNQTTQSINNLSPGVYSVTVTDANDCTGTGSATVSQPPQLIVSISTTPLSGPGSNDGTATANASGGVAPYNYFWSNGETTQIITGLAPGTYAVTITDSNDCQATATANISPFNCDMTVSVLSLQNPSCFGLSDGSIQLTVLNATGMTSYIWSNGTTESALENAIAGTYSVTVTDEDGCTATAETTLTQPDEIIITLTINQMSGEGNDDGSISADVIGGDGTYSYIWSNGETTSEIVDLAPGSYILTVTDGINCTKTATGVINQLNCDLTGHIVSEPILCFGDTNGAIQVVASSSNTPISYLWEDGSTDEIREDLGAGEYSVTVTDEQNCILELTITLTEPEQLSHIVVEYTPQITDEGTGILSILGSGGTPPYAYEWSFEGNFYSNENEISNLQSGVYSLLVSDFPGCTHEADFEIILITSTSSTDADKFQLELFPNPTGDQLWYEIKGNKSDFSWTIKDQNGKSIKEGKIDSNNDKQSIVVSDLMPGVYFMSVKLENILHTAKFIKK